MSTPRQQVPRTPEELEERFRQARERLAALGSPRPDPQDRSADAQDRFAEARARLRGLGSSTPAAAPSEPDGARSLDIDITPGSAPRTPSTETPEPSIESALPQEPATPRRLPEQAAFSPALAGDESLRRIFTDERERLSLPEELARGLARGGPEMLRGAGRMIQALPSILGDPLAEMDRRPLAERVGLREEASDDVLRERVDRLATRREQTRSAGRAIEELGAAGAQRFPRSAAAERGETAPTIAAGVGEAVPQLGAQIALAMATGGASAMTRFLMFAGPTVALEGGSAYAETLEDTGDEELAAGVAMSTALGAVALERIPAARFVFGRIPGARRLFGARAAEVLAGKGQGLISRMATGAASEGIEEALQEAWGSFIQDVQANNPDAWEGIVRRMALGATVGGIVGAGAGAVLGDVGGATEGTEGEEAAPDPPPPPPAAEGRGGVRRRIADAIDPSRRAELERLHVDELTGVRNRDAFQRAKPRLEEDPETELVLVDLQNFKAINDNVSLEAGDQTLREVAGALRDVARQAGVDERDVFRAGGDEFVIAVPRGMGDAVGQALQDAVDDRVRFPATGLPHGVRYGVGATMDAADARTREAKAGEEGERFRDVRPADERTDERTFDQEGADEAAADRLTHPISAHDVASAATAKDVSVDVAGERLRRAGYDVTDEMIEESRALAASERDAFDRAAELGERERALAELVGADPESIEFTAEAIEQRRREALAAADARREASPEAAALWVSPDEVDVEPERFQYKESLNPQGETGALADVRAFDENRAGIVMLWRDPADGRLKVVNGHQRVGLARRLGAPRLRAMLVDAESAEEARVEGALVNIGEGSGTAVDAAKVFRQTGFSAEDMRARGVPLQGQVAKDGLALSKLHDGLFSLVARGRVPMARGAVIGRSGLAPEQQMALWKLVEQQDSKRRLTNDEIEELARFVRGSGTEEATQETLFGTETFDQSLALEKARLSAWVKQQLRKQARLFKFVARGERAEQIQQAGVGTIDTEAAGALGTEAAQVSEVYERLSASAGPVSDALNRAVREIRAGAKENEVRSGLLEAVRAAVQEVVGGPEGQSGTRGEASPESQQPLPGGEAGPPAGRVAPAPDALREEIAANAPGYGEFITDPSIRNRAKDLARAISELPRAEAEAGLQQLGRVLVVNMDRALGRASGADFQAARQAFEADASVPAPIRAALEPFLDADPVDAYQDASLVLGAVRREGGGGPSQVREGGPALDLFGQPVRGQETQGELLPSGGPQGLSAAVEAAQATVSSLEGRVERGAATPHEVRRYREARALLRRDQGMDAEDLARRREDAPPAEPDDTGDLFGGPDGGPDVVREEPGGFFGLDPATPPRMVQPGYEGSLRQRIDRLIFRLSERVLPSQRAKAQWSQRANRMDEVARFDDHNMSLVLVHSDGARFFVTMGFTADPRPVFETDDGDLAVDVARHVHEAMGEIAGANAPETIHALGTIRAMIESGSTEVRERDPRYVREQLELTFGSLDAAAEVVRAMKSSAPDLVHISIAGTQSVAERRAAVEAGKDQFASVPATGQRIASNSGVLDKSAVFQLLRAYRHPTAEYWHVLVVKEVSPRRMEVVHHRMTSSGALDVGLVYSGDYVEAAAIARRVGGQVILAHNHPSGNPSPSPEDKAVTRQAAAEITAAGAEYSGHYVINGESAVVLDHLAAGTPLNVPLAAGQVDWNQPNVRSVRGPEDIFRYLRALPNDGRRIDVLYLNKQGHLIAFEPRSLGDLDAIDEWMPGTLRDIGAANVAIGVSSDVAYDQVIGQLRSVALPVLDVVEVTTQRSARERKDLAAGMTAGPTMVPIFEEAAPYGESGDVQREGAAAGRPASAPAGARTVRERGPVEGEGPDARPEEGRAEGVESDASIDDVVEASDGSSPVLATPEGAPAGSRTVPPADAVVYDTTIYPNLPGRLAPPKNKPRGRPVSSTDVIEKIARVTAAAGKLIPFRVGRVRGRGVRGFFKVRPEVIRTRSAGDIPTSAHEMAHALEKLLYGWPMGGPWTVGRAGVDRTMQTELVALGKALYGDRKPAGGYKREGWAEWIRAWITSDTATLELAPELRKWFDGTFMPAHPEVNKALLVARDTARRYQDQGATLRAKANMVDPASLSSRLLRTARAVRGFFTMEKLVEMGQPIYELAREAEERAGRTLLPSDDPFTLLSALRTTHDARVEQMVTRGMLDLAGNVVGQPLDDVRALVKPKERQDFLIYLWARRAVALWTDPEGSRDPGISIQDAQQILEELGSDRFSRAADVVYAWNAGILDYAAQASPTFREVVERVRERDPGDYVPLQRHFDELARRWGGGGGKPGVGKSSPVKRLKGSGRRIKDPFQSMIAQARQIVAAAHERAVVDAMVKLADVEGMGHIIEEVPIDRIPVAQRSIPDLLDSIYRRLTDLGVDFEGIDFSDPEAVDLAALTITFFGPKQMPGGRDPVVPVWDKDQLRWFELDPELFDALASLDIYRLPQVAGLPLLEATLGKSAEIFRAGTTGLRASFGLLWNPLRDPQTMWVNTRSSAAAPRLFHEWLKAMTATAFQRTTGKRTEFVDAFMRLGGEMAQVLGQDIPRTRRASRQLFEGRVVRTLDPRNWFDWFRDFIQFPESAPRVAELKLVAEEIGWEPGTPMTLNQSLELLLAAKHVTTDFTAAGELGRVMNRMVPFHNAAIQGPRANLRAMRRAPGRFAMRGLQLTALTMLLWWTNKDEEWWRRLPYRDKWLHWWFKIRIGGREELVRIPRAFEVGLVFSALPEMLADSWYLQDPDAAEEYFRVFVETAAPPGTPLPLLAGEEPDLPPLMQVASEQLANRDFFWSTPIVPMSEQGRPPEEQFNEYTSIVARGLGDMFGVSPRRIDHAIGGLFGPVAGDVIEAVGLGGAAASGEDREGEPADVLIFGRLFRRGGVEGPDADVERLYDALEEAQQLQASVREEETPLDQQRRLLLTDAARAVSALSMVRRSVVSVDERRRLSAIIHVIATDAADASVTERPRFAELRAQWEAVEETLTR